MEFHRGDDGNDYVSAGVSPALLSYIEGVQAYMDDPRKFDAWLLSVLKDVHKVKQFLEDYPPGPRRALAIFARLDAAINVWWKHMPKQKAGVSCFNCKSAGCCSVSVDVSEDEAALLATVVKNGEVDYSKERLELQHNVTEEGEGKFDEWGKLPFKDRRCIFLSEEGRCKVYDQRPIACRKWFVLDDPKNCDDYKGKAQVQSIPTAEVVASACYSTLKSGRLPRMFKEALESLNKE